MAAEAESAAPKIRTLRPHDAPALTRILQDSPEAAQWTEESYRALLDSSGAVAFVSETQGVVSGFVVGRQVADEAEVLNIAVAPTARRKGIGKALLRSALQAFRMRGTQRAFLEVRESNAAGIAFYERQGFAKVGKRAGYYRNPDEAAIVMERKLTG